MPTRRFAAVALAALALTSAPAPAADVENPEFAAWSKLKKGASVALKTTQTVNGTPVVQQVTHTLAEVSADRVAVVTEVVITTRGQVLKPNQLRNEIPKALALAAGQKKEDVLAGRPAGTFEEGTETVRVAGAEVKARWLRYKTDAPGAVAEGQVWVSADVPGMVVKANRTTGGQVPTTELTEPVEFKKP